MTEILLGLNYLLKVFFFFNWLWLSFVFVSFLGCFLGYVWVKHTEREIEKIKIKYEMDLEKKEETQTALVALKKVEHKLKERQYVYCSPFALRKRRLEIEDDLYQMSKSPIFAHLNMANELNYIFRNDHHCSPDRFNRNDEKNGSCMWDYIRKWENQLNPERAEADVLSNIKKLFRINP